MTKTIDMQGMRYLNLFERITRIRTRFFFNYNNMVVFCVPRMAIKQALGNENSNLKKMSQILKKKIRVVGIPNSIEDAERFIKTIISPVEFKELEIKKLVSLSKKLFVGEQLEVVNLRGNTILTDTSSISRTIGVFLCTLPYITYKSFLIALATSAEEKNLSILSKMVKENRLVTNKNIKEYKKLVAILEVAIKDFKINKKTVETSRLIKLVARFGTEEIENYLDEEHNILS